ncbi:MAG TPA: cytochrome c peroxidase [Polyangia bacterium]|nr:cytochrome c peroxidase [Polyangia bacterium]
MKRGGVARYVAASLLPCLLGFLPACTDASARPLPLTAAVAPTGFPAGPITASAPADNALTEARAQLGKRLFFDTGLSRTGDVACATCHLQERAFAQDTAVSVGVDGRAGTRNAPSLANLAWNDSLFWDGRVRTLEELTGKPIENPVEMDLPLVEAVARLTEVASYAQAFAEAYGGAPSELSLQRALASFVRTLVSAATPYDRFLHGDEQALTAPARRGLALFFNRAGCFRCHPPGALTNDGFFNNGSTVEGGDPGRQAITNRSGDLGKFKVPGLRNVAVTAPYMHDGSLPTLEDVVDQYARGGRGGPNTDVLIAPLDLTTDEKTDLISFLRALTDEAFVQDPRYH